MDKQPAQDVAALGIFNEIFLANFGNHSYSNLTFLAYCGAVAILISKLWPKSKATIIMTLLLSSNYL
jgi:hypothetical protein